jgi:hypothetical protein
MKVLSEHTGGAHWGDGPWTAHASTWPLAHLHICDDRLILTTTEGAFEFPRERVTRLAYKGGWLARALKLGFGALRIEHAVPDYPSFFLFKSFDISALCDALRAADFAVTT